MNKKKVTFNDIARHTGFSKTTISRFFNNPDSLTPQNQAIIRQALVDLDYKENKLAQVLAKGKTELVGVIVPNLYLHYFSEMLNQILHTNEESGYKFLVLIGSSDPETERRNLRELISYQIEGLIVMSHTLPSEEIASLGLPVVSIEREDRAISSVNCDNYMGAVQAVSLLYRQKCDVLIHINTPTTPDVPAYQRLTGFQDFCQEHEIPHQVYIRKMSPDYASMQKMLGEILDDIEERFPNQKRGIFFADDTRANAFLNLLIRRYQKLPASYRLVGFDNSPIATEAVYSISTVGQQIDVIAQEAVRLLLEEMRAHKEMHGRLPAPVHRVITPVLMRRETTELE